MIRVTIEMLPHGDESKKRHMGTVDIANDGTGTRESGNYKVRLSRMDSPSRAWKSGAIKGFNRITRGPHDLLLLALLSLVADRNKRIIDVLQEEYALASAHPDSAMPRIFGSIQTDPIKPMYHDPSGPKGSGAAGTPMTKIACAKYPVTHAGSVPACASNCACDANRRMCGSLTPANEGQP